MNTICVDGKMLASDQPALLVDNKSYRYGDGLFETMKMVNKKIRLADFHFERLFSSLKTLGYELPTLLNREKLEQQVLQVADKNKCSNLARIRLSVHRGNGGLYEGNDELHYVIECWPLNEALNSLNENGLILGIYSDARKSCDGLSNLKSANFLPYVMAARFAKQHHLNDCLILNTHDRIADSTIANLFIIKKDKFYTPALSEGCVAGVMRRYLIKELKVEETKLSLDDILNAEEVFLSNAIHGIKWVKQFGDSPFGNTKVVEIYKTIIQTI